MQLAQHSGSGSCIKETEIRSELRSPVWGHMLFALSQTYGDNRLSLYRELCPKQLTDFGNLLLLCLMEV